MSMEKGTHCEELINSVVNTAIGLILAQAVMPALFGGELSLYGAKLWIQPFNGYRAYQFPFYQALRIVRKHDWVLAEVEPIKPKKNLSYFLQAIAGIFLAIKHHGIIKGFKILRRLGQ